MAGNSKMVTKILTFGFDPQLRNPELFHLRWMAVSHDGFQFIHSSTVSIKRKKGASVPL